MKTSSTNQFHKSKRATLACLITVNRHFLYLSTLIVPLSPVKLLGGEYSQDFSEEIIDTSLFGGDYTPYLDSDYLVLTQDGRHGSNYWKLPLLDEGTSITEFNVEFDLQI